MPVRAHRPRNHSHNKSLPPNPSPRTDLVQGDVREPHVVAVNVDAVRHEPLVAAPAAQWPARVGVQCDDGVVGYWRVLLREDVAESERGGVPPAAEAQVTCL